VAQDRSCLMPPLLAPFSFTAGQSQPRRQQPYSRTSITKGRGQDEQASRKSPTQTFWKGRQNRKEEKRDLRKIQNRMMRHGDSKLPYHTRASGFLRHAVARRPRHELMNPVNLPAGRAPSDADHDDVSVGVQRDVGVLRSSEKD
jgi:hypothetical protein